MSICGTGDGVNGLGVKGEEKHWNHPSECGRSTAKQTGQVYTGMSHTLTHTETRTH